MRRHFKFRNEMDKGFSLLEVVLAGGILGGVLAGVLSLMVDSGHSSEEQTQLALLLNTQRSVQNILTREHKELADQLYCGYKDGKFKFNTNRANLDTVTAVLVKGQEQQSLDGKVNLKTYKLGVLDSGTGNMRTRVPHLEVIQSVISTNYDSFTPNDPSVPAINSSHVAQVTAISEGSSKHGAAWTYASVSSSSYGSSSTSYAASQMFEYISEATQNYGYETIWDESTKQSAGNDLLYQLNSNGIDRQSNWENLKSDSVLGTAATLALEAHYALANALADGSVSLSEAQNKLSVAMDEVYSTVSSNSTYLNDYNNTIDAYEAANLAVAQTGSDNQTSIFRSILSDAGTSANSYGTQFAAIMMSLGSSQNLLDSYLASLN